MRTKKFMLTALMMVIAVGVSAQSVEMGKLSAPKSKRGDRPETGYVGTVELSVNGHLGDFDSIPVTFGIATTHGYAVSPFFTIGAGVAIDLTREEVDLLSFSIPAFLNMRTYFIRYGKVRPFLDLRAGYQFPLSTRTHEYYKQFYDEYGSYYDYGLCCSRHTEDKGIYLNLTLGIRIAKRLDISAEFGYKTRNINYTFYNGLSPDDVPPYYFESDWSIPWGVKLAYRF